MAIDDQDQEQQGITAYHGSPHDFEKFDSSKIGTGEGAQAYSHGLYFAESEPIAQHYRDALSGTAPQLKVDGKTLSSLHMSSNIDDHLKKQVGFAYHQFNDLDKAIDYVAQQIEGKMTSKFVHPLNVEQYKEDLASLENMRQNRPTIEPHTGHMYEVHIDAHPDHFLDWDKPLNEQSGHVQTALKPFSQHLHQAAQDMFDGKPEDLTGADLYHWFSGEHEHGFGSEKNTSDALHQMGIKGVKYLDAGSRGTTDKPTRNYVVFDDKLVNVKRKYALGGDVEGYADGGVVHRHGYSVDGGVPEAGSTGSASGNSYGGGSSGDTGGVSMSSGNGRDNSMAAARAADRASVAGYSASPTSAGKGFGGGDGRDYAGSQNRAYPQPSSPHTPTPFSGYPQEVQRSLNPDRPDSAFGNTLADPTGKYTNQALQNMGTATDALTMLNSPTLMGSVVRAFAPTPSQPTPQQESQMAKIFSPNMPIARIGDPSLGARAGSVGSMPSGTTSYGSDLTPSGSSVSRPVTPTPSTAYGGNSSQDSSNRGLGSFAGSLGAQGPAQQSVAPRQDFNSAFAAARSGGNKTFNWTNPRTGKTGTYGTQLARKEGGRVPSMSEPDEWLIDENKTEKKPVKKANKQVSKPERSPIVSRALMISSRKS